MDAGLPALVVVPRAPGPLIVPPPTRGRDDVDVGLDELFGPPIDQKPGPLDAALVVGGIGGIAVAEVAFHGGPLLVAGVASTLLGLVLPGRSLYRAVARGRARGRLDAVLKDGDPLNLGDTTTRRLAEAYSRVIDGGAAGDPFAEEASASALQALQEVAALLKGRTPRGAAEQEYVGSRLHAVEGLERSLAAGAGSTVEAFDHFEQASGLNSIDRIQALRSAVHRSHKL